MTAAALRIGSVTRPILPGTADRRGPTTLAGMDEQVAAAIREAIADHGPIAFAEFMEHALYGPGGFFERPPVGAEGHFVTSPHVHPWVFAHCLRGALLESWALLGEPDPLPVLELGAGDGTLARALLAAFGELPLPRPAYTAVEIGPGARAALRELGVPVVASVAELEPFEGVVVANELLDNLPFLLAQGRAGGASEVRIGLEGDALVEVEVPWTHPLPEGLALELSEGERTAVPVGAFALLERLAVLLRRGHVVLVDYGMGAGPTGGAHGYRGHRATGDLLSAPGTTDVTSGVDFGMVEHVAARRGFEVLGRVRQRAALEALGFGRWAETMRETQATLQRSGRQAEATRVWQVRSRASLLVDPEHLGSFWWLVLGTPGLGRPPWLDRAAESPPLGPPLD
jgi:SAM-dependent MidA family methyltransferase